jgi:hypothetical protein
MLNKRRRLIDPTKISNYNKFLSTLDNNSNLNSNLNPNLNPNLNHILYQKYKDLRTDDDIKNELDKIINNINHKFKIGYSSNHFTGKNPTDTNNIDNNDPNYYREIMNINNNISIYPYTYFVNTFRTFFIFFFISNYECIMKKASIK